MHQDETKQASPSDSASAETAEPAQRPLLLCLSHLRWGFVYQRPQHVMSRLAQGYDVAFFEEPVFEEPAAAQTGSAESPRSWLEQLPQPEGVIVLVPHLPHGLSAQEVNREQRALLDAWLHDRSAAELILWYYTPMSLSFSDHLWASVTVFDCMDELSAFKGAPPELVDMEKDLMERADVVFTGGYSLWDAKSQQHPNAHAMPSSVDIAHFAAARDAQDDPPDQQHIAHPRLGFFGVIDERFDIELVRELAAARPDWQVVLIGPVVKIDPDTLPRLDNIHYLGGKRYNELPVYLSGWDVALMPFALNESTRFISPTKTPEYLAGGCPVVSTPITDVIRSYGDSGVVTIAATADEFVSAIEQALGQKGSSQFLERVDAALAGMSWDKTCASMKEQIECLR
jgi:glycosyltransferase involved in cell wall biosynthesis